MLSETLEKIIRKYTIKNYYEYGKVNPKAVVGKVIAEDKEAKAYIKEIFQKIKEIEKEIEGMSKQEIEQIIKNSKFIERKKEDPLRIPNVDRKVITRFMPEPNGYLHIGHAKAAFLNYEIAKKYDGEMILRIDDTNPENERQEFVENIKEDLKWLGVEWKKEIYTSDYIDELYGYAIKLIEKQKAYVCTCNKETIRENRRKGISCSCRNRNVEENKQLFEKLKKGEIEGVLRFKGDMEAKNTAMRDPVLMRIIRKPHYRQGNKYLLWPNYDFSAPITDSIFGITHAMRSKEYELREELYYAILDALELRKPTLIHFARLNIKGMPISKRLIKPLIEQKIVSGWDDPRLPTIKGLKRRGIVQEAIKNFVLSFGIGKAESQPGLEKLLAENRKVLDKIAKHRFFVPEPIEVKINYKGVVKIKDRIFDINNKIYLPKKDIEGKKRVRLKDWKTLDLETGALSDEKASIVQWLPKGYECKVYVPKTLYDENGNLMEMEEIKGICEDKEKIVQFERFGYCKKDSDEPLTYIKSS